MSRIAKTFSNNEKWQCTFNKVSTPGAWRYSDCYNQAKHDLDANGNPTRCGIHSAASIAKRQAKSTAKSEKDWAEFKRKQSERKAEAHALSAIRKIAAGHNDPRGLAQEILNELGSEE